ncbi:hypothetical protein [Salibacter sp.]|jgi:hypothetical protein|uniref:hypothetical protein n=1 Tax=Salibacter sp. TaxID=2010995 RepID=UPI0028703AB3|nr:hypothetical protein [Salibacter sp.]MDR9398508.1 hypothetical protein [Salibacter sp.]MDR9486442.1 hypothetical protein [Salibacter sp.]
MKLIYSYLHFVSIALTLLFVTGCFPGEESGDGSPSSTKQIELTIEDIKGKTITYDFYQVNGDELEYVATEISDRDGSTLVQVEVDREINNIIIKRTKGGVEKRQVVPLRSNKENVQFVL